MTKVGALIHNIREYENSWTWGEVDVKDHNGNSKLQERQRIFTNLHADSQWQVHAKTFYPCDEGFMTHLGRGDTLEFYFRAQFPGWCIFVQNSKMVLHYDDPVRKDA